MYVWGGGDRETNSRVHRHDADLTFARLDDTRTIGPNQPRLGLLLERLFHPHLRNLLQRTLSTGIALAIQGVSTLR